MSCYCREEAIKAAQEAEAAKLESNRKQLKDLLANSKVKGDTAQASGGPNLLCQDRVPQRLLCQSLPAGDLPLQGHNEIID